MRFAYERERERERGREGEKEKEIRRMSDCGVVHWESLCRTRDKDEETEDPTEESIGCT